MKKTLIRFGNQTKILLLSLVQYVLEMLLVIALATPVFLVSRHTDAFLPKLICLVGYIFAIYIAVQITLIDIDNFMAKMKKIRLQ